MAIRGPLAPSTTRWQLLCRLPSGRELRVGEFLRHEAAEATADLLNHCDLTGGWWAVVRMPAQGGSYE